ncbi:MAG: hypothetical protein ABIK83_12045 [Candidatus Zixiibacteriota bacterium]
MAISTYHHALIDIERSKRRFAPRDDDDWAYLVFFNMPLRGSDTARRLIGMPWAAAPSKLRTRVHIRTQIA